MLTHQVERLEGVSPPQTQSLGCLLDHVLCKSNKKWTHSTSPTTKAPVSNVHILCSVQIPLKLKYFAHYRTWGFGAIHKNRVLQNKGGQRWLFQHVGCSAGPLKFYRSHKHYIINLLTSLMACTTASHDEDLKKENEIKWDLVHLQDIQHSLRLWFLYKIFFYLNCIIFYY